MQKRCSRCGESKDLNEFYFNKRDGNYVAQCKECDRRRCRDRARRISKTFDAAIYENRDPSATKRCPSCQEHKPVADFKRDRFTIDGLRSRCDKCDKLDRRFKRANHDGRIIATTEELVSLYENNPYCHYCKCPLEPYEISFEHKTPLSRDPDSDDLKSIDNLTISCRDCNRLKWTMDEAEFFAFLRNYREQLNSIEL